MLYLEIFDGLKRKLTTHLIPQKQTQQTVLKEKGRKTMGIVESSYSVLIKIAYRFEVLYPQAIKFLVNRKLEEYKTKGTLTEYKVKTKRMGKFHYFLEMDLFVTDKKGGEGDIWN